MKDMIMLNPGDYVGVSFWIISAAMVAATFFFWVERDRAVGKWKTSLTVAAMVTGIAAIHYFYMREVWVVTSASPTVLRYVDWLLTVPLQNRGVLSHPGGDRNRKSRSFLATANCFARDAHFRLSGRSRCDVYMARFFYWHAGVDLHHLRDFLWRSEQNKCVVWNRGEQKGIQCFAPYSNRRLVDLSTRFHLRVRSWWKLRVSEYCLQSSGFC